MAARSEGYLDIFLPFYGDVGLLKETINSVLAQDTSDWRLTVINDAHPDRSVDDWVREINHPNIQYLRNELNLGPARNFAKCIEFSSASHCVFLGADDLLLPNFVSVINRELGNNPEVLLIQPGVRVVDELGTPRAGLVDRIKAALWQVTGSGLVKPERMMATLMLGSWLYFPSLVWRVDKVKEFGFDPSFNVCQDLDLAIKVLSSPGRVLVLPEITFGYRRHSASDSATKLLNGERFEEERRLHYILARRFLNNRRLFLAILALFHISSRLHAIITLPKIFGDRRAFWKTFKHILT